MIPSAVVAIASEPKWFAADVEVGAEATFMMRPRAMQVVIRLEPP